MALEMGLHKWLILSKHAEAKQTRTNLKKLGCLFEAFLGAMFLDCNKLAVQDEHFQHTFLTGPGFQMVQVFVENVFEKHVDWIHLIKNDDNYKNILQVRIQKEFKVTPDYLECSEYNMDRGYHMGVYLCLGQPIYAAKREDAIHATTFLTQGDLMPFTNTCRCIDASSSCWGKACTKSRKRRSKWHVRKPCAFCNNTNQ